MTAERGIITEMALYAIGDLHLAFQSEVRAPMQTMGKVWIDHERKFKENCEKVIKETDTLVLLGDHSWGRKLKDCRQDLQYISDLPGRKILLRGNHDMFWDVKKTGALNEEYKGKLEFLQNNYFAYEDYALVGTKGYCYEGKDSWDHAIKLVDRELDRLETSFELARSDGYRKFIMFLHYPPTNIFEKNSGFTKMAERYKVEQVVYAHCHGQARFHDSIRGKKRGIRYSLASGDCLRWHPLKILN